MFQHPHFEHLPANPGDGGDKGERRVHNSWPMSSLQLANMLRKCDYQQHLWRNLLEVVGQGNVMIRNPAPDAQPAEQAEALTNEKMEEMTKDWSMGEETEDLRD